MRRVLRQLALAGALLAGAGAAQAQAACATGCAWRAQYALNDAHGARTLTVVRGEDRIEYSEPRAPVHVWLRDPQGMRHVEAYVDEGRAVEFSPGDLAALDRGGPWTGEVALVPAGLRAALQPRRHPRGVARYGGLAVTADARDAAGATLQWLGEAALPARYRGADGSTLQLVSLARVPTAQAYTALDALRPADYADLGDLPGDAFAQRAAAAAGHAH